MLGNVCIRSYRRHVVAHPFDRNYSGVSKAILDSSRGTLADREAQWTCARTYGETVCLETPKICTQKRNLISRRLPFIFDISISQEIGRIVKSIRRRNRFFEIGSSSLYLSLLSSLRNLFQYDISTPNEKLIS